MEYKLTFEDGSSAYLEHHGIKGMKWGVRNAETLAKYAGGNGGQRPTRMQTKRAIRTMERQQYRRSGGLFGGGKRVVGQNTAAVQKAHQRALDDDEKYQNLSRKAQLAERDYNRAYQLQSSTRDLFDNTMNDESKKSGYRAAAAIGSAAAAINTQSKQDAYFDASQAAYARREKIARQFTSQYEDAFLKDLGFKDVEAGKKFLHEQKMEPFFNRRIMRYQGRVQ